MKKLWLLLFLFATPSLFGAITAGNRVNCVAAANPTLTCANTANPLAVTAGQLVIVAASVSTSWASSYNTPSDTGCGLTYTRVGSSNDILMWSAPVTATGSCVITVSRTQGNDAYFQWVAQAYSGVADVGNAAAGSANNVTSCSQSLVTQDANNWVIGGFKVQASAGTSSAGTITATAPSTVRFQNERTVGQFGTLALIENIATTPASTPLAISWTASGLCSRQLVELRTITVGGRNAVLADQTRDVLLSTNGPANYTLPSQLLSPAWCAWLMPTGTGVYNLNIQSPSLLNGQSNNIDIPRWQMSRICEDSSSNYWAEPPLVAGTGVTITPSATAITISTAGGGGTVAAGTFTFPGGNNVNVGACGAVTTVSAIGIVTTDVVTWSNIAQPGGNWEANLKVNAWPSAGAVNFNYCNVSNAPVTPAAATFNWRVAR